MSKVRFVDNVGVNAFGNVSPEAIITASGGVGNIIFTKENGNQIILPLATTQSSADSLTTASVAGNIITFTKGDLSTFSITVATGSSGESVNTGSLLTTGSANLNVLTFTKGDGTSFTLTVDTGSGAISAGTVSSSAQITELGFVTSSATASFITNSQTSSMSVLSAQTASYVLNAVSSSHALFAISASYAVSSSHEIVKEISSSHANFADTASKALDNVLTASVSSNIITFTKGDNTTFSLTVDTGSGEPLPSGTVSSSAQISELGFVTSSATASFVTNSQTGSFITNSQTSSMSVLLAQTASYVLNAVSSSFSLFAISASYAVSSSHEIIKEISSSHANFADTASKSLDNVLTASVVNNVITFTKGDTSTFSLTVDTGSGEPLPSGVISGSAQISEFGFVSQSGGIVNLPNVKIQYANVYANLVDLPAAANYHGMFAHVHATGKGYYAHGGAWIELANASSVNALTSSINNLTQATSSYIVNSQTSSMSVATASYVTSSNIVGNFTTSSIINFPTEVSRSAAAAGFGTGGESIPSGTVSSSAQITELGFVQSSITASSLETASVSNNTITFTKGNGDTFAVTVDTGSGTSIDTGSFVQNSQTSSMTVGTASIANFIPFDGNRSVSNQDQPSGIRNVNFNANGLADFINKVYFTNSAPVLNAQSITIEEFLPSGSTVATVTATDAETQSISFGTASTYTDDFFRIDSSTGVITMNVKSTASMNTFNDGGVLKAPFPVTATDTFNESGSLTYYIRITPNTAPIWSTVNNGSSTTSVTESIAEDSGLGTDKDRYYFRDTESDTITIGSGSFSTHFLTAFALTKQSGYVRLDQITSSLDFDLYPTYSFVLTASDEHYESGDDPSSITYLPVRINVTDNVAPTINPQTLTGVNEKSNTGVSAGIVAASDTEGNTITYSQFILKSAFLNSNPTVNLTSSLGGVSLQNPSSNPFSINPSTGQITRKSGQFLNVDIADRYVYTTTVRDNFNPVSASADITIPIANHVANTISISTVANIIETATIGDTVKRSSTGLGGNNTILSAANSSIQRWEITSTPDLIEATNITASSTTLRLKSNLSGSATVGGDTITLRITASQDDFDTTIQYLDKVVDVKLMAAPVLTPSDQTSNLNTNGARGSNNLVLVSITDPQSFTIDHSTWTFTPNAGQALEAVQNGGADSYYIRPTSNLAAGTYGYTASIFNDKGFRAGELKDEFTIAQAGSGTLTTNGTFYIIESALTNNPIVLDSNGRTGTTGSLGVDYDPEYNSAAVQAFTSSNAAIAVASNGNLTAGQNVSGSSNTFPGTITSNITWLDQYGNVGGPTAITVNISENTAPSATITPVSPTLEAPQNAGTKLADVLISDTEGDTPFNLSLTGTDAASLVAFPTNAISSSYEIRLAGTENTAVSFTYNAVVRDNFGKTQTYSNQTLSIIQGADYGKVYIYKSDYGSNAGFSANYNGVMGANTVNSETPPKVTSFTSNTASPYYKLKDGDMGSTSISLAGGKTMSLVSTISGSNLDTILSASSEAGLTFGSGVGYQLILAIPSGSDMSGVPTSMAQAFGGSATDEYTLALDTGDGYGVQGSTIQNLPLDSSHLGYDHWYILARTGFSSGASWKIRVIPSSGSLPS
jgi:hypothetical protein